MFSDTTVIFILCLVSITNAINTNNLAAVVQIFRHGERTPLSIYKTDPYKDYWGDLSLGELTKKGRRQLYQLGQYTRGRYADWIPVKYNKKFIHAETTDADRTHMSGQSFLYGLYPATDDEVWLPNINWQAIPLHPSSPNVVWCSKSNCSLLKSLYNELLESDDFKAINDKYKNVYHYISVNSQENITDVNDAYSIWDALNIENVTGLLLPNWTHLVFPEPLRTLSGLSFRTSTYNIELKKLFTGPLLYQIVKYFQNMATGFSGLERYRVYSAHESNIAAVLDCFGAFDSKPTEFAATIWMELRKNDKEYYVNIWSKNGENLNQVNVNGLLDCPLDQFADFLKDILIDTNSWIDKCNSQNEINV